MRTKELTRGLTREIHVSTKGAEDGGMPDTPEMAPPVGMDTEEEAMASGIGDATTAKEGLVCVECGELAGAFNWLYTRRPTFFNDAPLWKEDVEALQWSGKRLAGDSFYEATCAKCSAVSGTERLQRLQIPWPYAVALVLHDLSQKRQPSFTNSEGLRFYPLTDISKGIEMAWDTLWLKSRGGSWRTSISGALTGDKERFVRGPVGNSDIPMEDLWALAVNEPVRVPEHLRPKLNLRALKWPVFFPGGVLLDPSMPKKRKRTAVDGEQETSSTTIVKAQPKPLSSAKPNSSNNKKVSRGAKPVDSLVEYIDPKTAIQVYPDLENFRSSVAMCDHPTHSAPQMRIGGNGKTTVQSDKGYRMAKATHGVWEGFWYLEMTIDEHQGNTRIGWSQISGDLQAPCGYDAFSYAYRDNPGTLFHKSRKVEAPESYSSGYGPGDVIGISIYLPPLSEASARELARRIWDPLRTKDYTPIRTKPLEVAQSSEIRYFKNGKDLGIAFKDIYFGKYHPAVSSYMGGRVTVNFGPKFKYELPEGSSPYFFARDIRFLPDDKEAPLPLTSVKSAESLPTITESSVVSDFKVEESDQMDQTF